VKSRPRFHPNSRIMSMLRKRVTPAASILAIASRSGPSATVSAAAAGPR
jgi:hypothetical protein